MMNLKHHTAALGKTCFPLKLLITQLSVVNVSIIDIKYKYSFRRAF